MTAAIAPSTGALALRGLIATIVGTLVFGLLIARGAGALDSGVHAAAVLPAAAGKIPENAPVFYSGIRVGDVRTVTGATTAAGGAAGEPGSAVEMLLDTEQARRIPSDAAVRAVPRTLFGDIRIELIPPPQISRLGIAEDATLAPDTSPEAVQLYDVFTRATELIESTRPEYLQTTLTTLAQTLDGRGETIGRIIERTDTAGRELLPAAQTAADHGEQIAALAEDAAAASPDVVEILDEATRLSEIVSDRPGSLRLLLDAGLGAANSGADTLGRTNPNAILFVGDVAATTGDIATDPHGIVRTLEALEPMGTSGAQVFASGRFNITAVPSFQEPMPYGPEDCPVYDGVPSASCGPARPERPRPPVPAEEQPALEQFQAAAGRPGTGTSTPETTMLAPLLRGTVVTPR